MDYLVKMHNEHKKHKQKQFIYRTMKCLENIPYETFEDEHTGDGIGLNRNT